MDTSIACQQYINNEKLREIEGELVGYWSKDIWNLTDDFFEQYGAGKSWPWTSRNIFFTYFTSPIRDELKLYFYSELKNDSLKVKTTISYANSFRILREFLDRHYPNIVSLLEITKSNGLVKYKSYLDDLGFRNGHYYALLNSACTFLSNLYGEREEYEKDVWDVRRIPGARYTKNASDYAIRFDNIPPVFRTLVKEFVKYQLTIVSKTAIA
ncbi:hypothetical protein [uncultured Brevibacillus sp.]|uniref:hypothetical protein n=1 Tax=uncultured Brevibacillus sp. TaxID=169970 RepID=UPI002593F96F|nr:hypothetical protein [uncultured Brevibacillus sp.]